MRAGLPGITAALAGAASIQQSLTLRGVSRSVAFITLAQGAENLTPGQPISNPTADTLVYYMGRKDAAKIAQQLITQHSHMSESTPVHILEAVSTPRERQWTSTPQELAEGKADGWFDSTSPALIMIGAALKMDTTEESSSESIGSEIDDSLQNGQVLSNGMRRA